MTVPKMAKKTGGMAPKRKMKGGEETDEEKAAREAAEAAAEAAPTEAATEAPAEAAAAGETTDKITVGDKTYTVTVNGAKVCVEPAAEASFGGKKGKKRTQKKKGKKPRKSAKKAKK
tara:strand:+ start:820 stop:1170 length:351 start_codon:yes stop_codon:yes gene_type:complete